MNAPKLHDVVFFDVGGVLVDSHPDAVFVANQIGDGAASLVNLVDQAMWTHRSEYDAGATDREFWDRVAGDCGKAEVSDEILSRLIEHDVSRMRTPNEDALELIREVHASGVRLGILSNAPKSVAEEIQNASWSDIFDVFIFSYLYGVNKPNRAIYRRALEAVEIEDPKRILFVDDRKKNVRAAELMGMTGLIWHDVETSRQELQKMGLLS